jgi:hypothetical protein
MNRMPENFTGPILPVVKDKTFENERVLLDGFTYEGCTFLRCRLVYSGGSVHTPGSKFSPGCTVELWDAAARTASLLQGLCDSIPEIRLQMFPNWQSWNRDNSGSSTVH